MLLHFLVEFPLNFTSTPFLQIPNRYCGKECLPPYSIACLVYSERWVAPRLINGSLRQSVHRWVWHHLWCAHNGAQSRRRRARSKVEQKRRRLDRENLRHPRFCVLRGKQKLRSWVKIKRANEQNRGHRCMEQSAARFLKAFERTAESSKSQTCCIVDKDRLFSATSTSLKIKCSLRVQRFHNDWQVWGYFRAGACCLSHGDFPN